MMSIWSNINKSILTDYKTLVLICSNLSTLLKNGISIINALEIIKESIKNKEYINGIEVIQREIQRGNTISDAFKKTNKFPKILITMINVGESSGRLHESLDNAAIFYKNYSEVINKSISTLFYPILLLIMVNIIFIYMMFNIVPEFQEMYISLGASTTGLVEGLFFISEKFRGLGKVFIIYYLTYVVILPILICKILRSLNLLRFEFKIFKIYKEYKFISLMSIMLNSGVLIDKALNIIYINEENDFLKQIINVIIREISKGKSFSRAIKERKIFSKESEVLIRVGEESGTLEEKLKILKESNENKLYNYLNNFTNKLQPIFIAIMAFIIGGFLIIFMLPLYGAIG